ncbi:hypothetical protein B0H16DRAFT_1807392 [Mycena metata]|uniref:F-box domain-containing protein n=1 Tax=Mycena metata TaxID=1033252 RepID=A0AAD7JDM0_9AGAR|nr:hypothetical protein B0H16DRAFT_1807392 [Mycena metata]
MESHIRASNTLEGKSWESLILGHICQLWRQIALSTPELWNTIRLTSRGGLEPACINAFLSRAASLSLSISVDALNVDPVVLHAALNTIIPHSRNWAHLSIIGTAEIMRTFQVIHQQLPVLQSLKLDVEPPIFDDTFGTMFQHAPRLRQAHLYGFGLQRPPSREILSWTPNLVDLILGGVDLVDLPPLPHLQSIIFAHTNLSIQTDILSRLRAPIRRVKMVVASDLAPFTPPMAHPSSLVELSVDIISNGFVASPAIGCLAVLSSVRTLKITAHDYNPSSTNFSLHPLILRLLEDTRFLPALESLTIVLLEDSSGIHTPLDSRTLSDMLDVRGLRNFEFLSRRQIPDLDGKPTEFKAKGMQIHMKTVPELKFDYRRPEF